MAEATRRERLLALSEEEKEARLSLVERIALLEPEAQRSFLAGLPPRRWKAGACPHPPTAFGRGMGRR